MRAHRGYRLRRGLDDETYARTRAIRARIELLLATRRTRMSARVGAWYRARVCARRFARMRQGAVKIQSVARLLLARGETKRRAATAVSEVEAMLSGKGLAVKKFNAKGK